MEESLAYFSGDDQLSVKKWVIDFKDTSKLLGWNQLQKFICAKRMLRGSAKQFIAAEKGVVSWEILKRRLGREFKSQISSAMIHSQLYKRKRQPNETGRQYVYAMLEIASAGKIADEAIVEYVSNGIIDEEANGTILYQSRTITELKENLDIYNRMKAKVGQKSNKKGNKKGKKEKLRRTGK